MGTLLIELIEAGRAGNPEEAGVYRECLRPLQTAKLFYERQGPVVSHGVVKRMLKELGYGFRKQPKQLGTGC
jgi:hypothetical protein